MTDQTNASSWPTADPESSREFRILLVQSRGPNKVDRQERLARQRSGAEPFGMMVEEVLGCDVIDEQWVEEIPGLRGRIYGRIPVYLAQAWEARRLARGYDVVITWSERLTVVLATLLTVSRRSVPHLALMFWISKPAVRLPLRFFRRGLDLIVTWSSVQAEFAVGSLGFDPDQVVLVRHPVDLDFYRPQECERTGVFSAGTTMRDYPTLFKAVAGLPVQVDVAAASVTVTVKHGLRSRAVDAAQGSEIPANVSMSPRTHQQVRDAFAHAQAVVVPLHESNMDAGVNVILEAMAMGRPVIASRTRGQVDVIDDGVTGFLVPVGDHEALQAKIVEVCADREGSEQVGRRARAYAEASHGLRQFAQKVRTSAIELAADWPQGSSGTARRRRLRSSRLQQRSSSEAGERLARTAGGTD